MWDRWQLKFISPSIHILMGYVVMGLSFDRLLIYWWIVWFSVLTFQVNLPQPCNMDAALDNWVRLHCFFFQLPWQWQPTSRLTEISGPSSTESRKNRRSAIGDLSQNSSNDRQEISHHHRRLRPSPIYTIVGFWWRCAFPLVGCVDMKCVPREWRAVPRPSDLLDLCAHFTHTFFFFFKL